MKRAQRRTEMRTPWRQLSTPQIFITARLFIFLPWSLVQVVKKRLGGVSLAWLSLRDFEEREGVVVNWAKRRGRHR